MIDMDKKEQILHYHRLLQRVQVHTKTQGGEVEEAEGCLRQGVVRARPGVRVRLGRGQAHTHARGPAPELRPDQGGDGDARRRTPRLCGQPEDRRVHRV